MILNILAIVLAVVWVTFLGYHIWTKGVSGALVFIVECNKKCVRALIQGVPADRFKKETVEPDCIILHQIASLEQDLYGSILSGSVLTHMLFCHKHGNGYTLFVDYKEPSRCNWGHAGCKGHQNITSVHTLDGTRHDYCIDCGTSRTVPYRPAPLPDPVRITKW